MKIISARHITSAVKPEQYPATGFPEIAFAGRSNVGKSSLINSLCSKKGMAHTSGQPGKTQTLNFFAINEQFYLVDLPGYGYAKESKEKRRVWGDFITEYLQESERLALVVHLIDLRHEPMENDKEASAWFTRLDVPYVIVGTKCDKIGRGKRQAHIAALRRGLDLPEHVPALVYSSESGEGKDELWRFIRGILGSKK